MSSSAKTLRTYRAARRRAAFVAVWLVALMLTSAASVRDFGAVGDGRVDDAPAIQRAADKGGTLEFPSGTYLLSRTIDIDLKKTGPIALASRGTARIVMAGEGAAFRFVGTHQGTAAPNTAKPEVLTRERFPLVEGLEIVGDHANADGIEASGTIQLTVVRSRLSKLRHGIHLVNRNRNVLIADCHIYDNRGVGVFLDNVNLHQTNISASHISYCAAGGVVSRAGEVRNLHITGCDIESNMTADAPATANVLLDSRGGSIAEVAVTGCTIQHNSTSPDSANIRLLGPGDELRAKSDDGKKTQEGQVTITGNVFSDVRVNVHIQHARGVVVSGNTFWEGFDRDLMVEDSSNVVIGANNLDRNPRYEIWQKERPKQGVLFRNSADCTISGLHVNAVSAHPAGVVMENCRRMNVTGCTILDCESTGLLLRNVQDSIVHGCLIRSDKPDKAAFRALLVEGGRGNTLPKE
jgi:hypothetical protein